MYIPVAEIADIDVIAVFLVPIEALSFDWTGVPVGSVAIHVYNYAYAYMQ